MCADYRRKLPDRTTQELRALREADARDVVQFILPCPSTLRARVYRTEVTMQNQVRFVSLEGAGD
ncbi:MAG: hypothetical protein LC772_01150 [Chloroflexi bacterium]|nr:hypothetical protein [Chloroflexota bacterium]